MSRSGYSDECDAAEMNLWRGVVKSAMRGKRGQAMLREMLEALEAMPEKRLVTRQLKSPDGDVCAMGALGVRRGIDMDALDPDEPEEVARAFDVAAPLVREIAYENDERDWHWAGKDWVRQTPEERWQRMHDWVKAQIRGEA